MRGICPGDGKGKPRRETGNSVTVAKIDIAHKTAGQLLYTFILFILFIFRPEQRKHFAHQCKRV